MAKFLEELRTPEFMTEEEMRAFDEVMKDIAADAEKHGFEDVETYINSQSTTDTYDNLPSYFRIECELAADELNMDFEEYLEFICQEQYGMGFFEAYEKGLVC